MVDKTQAVNSANGIMNNTSSQQKTTAQLKAEYRNQGKYYVGSGESLYAIAKNANMTLTDFKKKTGLIKDSLQLGQLINNIPTKAIKSGQGLQAFCRENNVDYHLFLALNCIDNKYIAQPSEKFFMPAADKTTPKPTPKPEPQKTTPTTPQKDDNKNVKTITYNGKKYKLDTVPKCGYQTAIGGQHSVSHPGGSYPSVPVDANGKIVAEVIKFSPSSKGKLTGKTIMVNAGHGWGYYNGSPIFDIGTDAKDRNGKTLEEWNKNRNYADNLISSLCAEGATVIYTTGKAKQVCDAKKKFAADILISIHCNASPKSAPNGLHIYYADKAVAGKKLAETVSKNFKKKINSNTDTKSDGEGQHSSIGILRANSNDRQIPSILIEMGFMSNPTDIANIDSKFQRQKAMDQVTQSIIEYLNPPKPKKTK